MSTYNATCQIIEPRETASADDSLRSEHGELTHPLQRCSLRHMGTAAEATVFGLASSRAMRCRLQSKLPIAAGWRVRARRDGEALWREFVIRRAVRINHWDLLLEAA